jgi:hypothetical protein
MTGKAKVTLTDEDLRELFAFFSSPTDEELHRLRGQVKSGIGS